MANILIRGKLTPQLVFTRVFQTGVQCWLHSGISWAAPQTNYIRVSGRVLGTEVLMLCRWGESAGQAGTLLSKKSSPEIFKDLLPLLSGSSCTFHRFASCLRARWDLRIVWNWV